MPPKSNKGAKKPPRVVRIDLGSDQQPDSGKLRNFGSGQGSTPAEERKTYSSESTYKGSKLSSVAGAEAIAQSQIKNIQELEELIEFLRNKLYSKRGDIDQDLVKRIADLEKQLTFAKNNLALKGKTKELKQQNENLTKKQKIRDFYDRYGVNEEQFAKLEGFVNLLEEKSLQYYNKDLDELIEEHGYDVLFHIVQDKAFGLGKNESVFEQYFVGNKVGKMASDYYSVESEDPARYQFLSLMSELGLGDKDDELNLLEFFTKTPNESIQTVIRRAGSYEPALNAIKQMLVPIEGVQYDNIPKSPSDQSFKQGSKQGSSQGSKQGSESISESISEPTSELLKETIPIQTQRNVMDSSTYEKFKKKGNAVFTQDEKDVAKVIIDTRDPSLGFSDRDGYLKGKITSIIKKNQKIDTAEKLIASVGIKPRNQLIINALTPIVESVRSRLKLPRIAEQSQGSISQNSRDIERQRLAMGLIEADRDASQRGSQKTNQTASKGTVKSSSDESVSVYVSGTDKTVSDKDMKARIKGKETDNFIVLNQSMSKSEKMALSKQHLQLMQGGSYGKVSGSNNGMNMSNQSINRINRELGFQNSSVLPSNNAIRTQINSGVIALDPNPLAHEFDIENDLMSLSSRLSQASRRLGLPAEYSRRLEQLPIRLLQVQQQAQIGADQAEQRMAQNEQIELTRQTQGSQLPGSGIANMSAGNIVAQRDQTLSDQTSSLNAIINSRGYTVAVENTIARGNLTQQQAQMARQALDSSNIFANLIASSSQQLSQSNRSQLESDRSNRSQLLDQDYIHLHPYVGDVSIDGQDVSGFLSALYDEQYYIRPPRGDPSSSSGSSISGPASTSFSSSSASQSQSSNGFGPSGGNSQGPQRPNQSIDGSADLGSNLLVSDADMSFDFANLAAGAGGANLFDAWAAYVNRANNAPQVQGDPAQPRFRMPKVAITGDELAKYVTQAVKFISEISGPISSVILATYKKQTSVFKGKIEKKETTKFKVKPGAMFRLRCCD